MPSRTVTPAVVGVQQVAEAIRAAHEGLDRLSDAMLALQLRTALERHEQDGTHTACVVPAGEAGHADLLMEAVTGGANYRAALQTTASIRQLSLLGFLH